MANVKIEGDATGYLAALRKAKRALKENQNELDKTKKKSRDLNREAQRIREAVNPQARFNRKVAEAIKLREKEKLSLKDLHRAQRQYYNDMLRQQDRLSGKMRSRGGMFGGGFFAPGQFGGKLLNSAITQMAAAATGIVGVGTVIQGIQATRARNVAASQRVETSLPRTGQLQQLDNYRFSRWIEDQLRNAGATPEMAPQIAFRLRSASSAIIPQIVRAVETGFLTNQEAIQMPTQVSKISNVFKGRRQSEILDKVIAMAGPMGAGPSEAVRAFSEMMGIGAQMGFSMEELMAALQASEQQAGSVFIAATRQKNVLMSLARKRLGRGTLAESIQQFQGMDQSRLITLLGSQEASQGVNDILIAGQDFKEAARVLEGASGNFDRMAGKIYEDRVKGNALIAKQERERAQAWEERNLSPRERAISGAISAGYRADMQARDITGPYMNLLLRNFAPARWAFNAIPYIRYGMGYTTHFMDEANQNRFLQMRRMQGMAWPGQFRDETMEMMGREAPFFPWYFGYRGSGGGEMGDKEAAQELKKLNDKVANDGPDAAVPNEE